MNPAETDAELIDPALRTADCGIIEAATSVSISSIWTRALTYIKNLTKKPTFLTLPKTLIILCFYQIIEIIKNI